MLPDVLFFLAAFLIGALLYRTHGGFLPTGSTQLARAIWCIPTGVGVALLSGAPWPVAAATVLTAFAGLMIPHSDGQDLGRSGGSEAEDFALLSAIGMARLYLILLPSLVAAYGLVMLVPLAGLLHGVAYWIGYRLPIPRIPRWWNPVDYYTAWAELLWGGSQYLVLLLFCLAIAGTL